MDPRGRWSSQCFRNFQAHPLELQLGGVDIEGSGKLAGDIFHASGDNHHLSDGG